MIVKNKIPLSGNSMVWAGSFENHSKTYHNRIYIRKRSLFLDVRSFYGIYFRRFCERNLLC